jgi:hypothetical protein
VIAEFGEDLRRHVGRLKEGGPPAISIQILGVALLLAVALVSAILIYSN